MMNHECILQSPMGTGKLSKRAVKSRFMVYGDRRGRSEMEHAAVAITGRRKVSLFLFFVNAT